MNSVDRLLRLYEIYWQHYKLQNDCLEKRRYIFWLIESALLLGWYKTRQCNFLWIGTCLLGAFVSFSWFIVSLRIRRSIRLTTTQLESLEIDLREMINIFRRERIDVRYLSSQRLWLDTLHPIIFIIIWVVLLYFISINYIYAASFMIISIIIVVYIFNVWIRLEIL